jgi:outer membrane protein assembly factor BamB
MHMARYLGIMVLIVSAVALCSSQPEDAGWRISPENINIQVGDDRPLQLLDDSAQELSDGIWFVDDSSLADIHDQQDGRVVVHAKAPGTVVVQALRGVQSRLRHIKIWPAGQLALGMTGWGTHPIGREIGDIPAVPTDGSIMFSLEETAGGSTHLRAVRDNGIQVWTWLMPEKNHDVELVCGDWLGGALISSNHGDSYTLYTVGSDGNLRWQRNLEGVRKAHAYNLNHLVHVLSQSRDGLVTKITGLDEVTGEAKFELTVPASREQLRNVRRFGKQILCASNSSTPPVPPIASRMFVNMDGFAYLAFTQSESALSTGRCTVGSTVAPRDVTFARDERVVLWQIHPDGTYRSTVVEESKETAPLSRPMASASPTGAIIPDGFEGVLLSMRSSPNPAGTALHRSPDEFIYRLDQDGKVVYKLLLPKFEGPLHDGMVLGENALGFATRGSNLIAFNVRNGVELWRWSAQTPGIGVYAALADGGVLVQTPDALVKVNSTTASQEVFKGQAVMDWQGKLYRKHN